MSYPFISCSTITEPASAEPLNWKLVADNMYTSTEYVTEEVLEGLSKLTRLIIWQCSLAASLTCICSLKSPAFHITVEPLLILKPHLIGVLPARSDG